MGTTASPRKRPARERLLDTADRLFYEEGVRAVGIDRVLEQSGVAKGSLYYNFGSKDDLVRAYLQNRQANWAARIDSELATADFRAWLHGLFATLVSEAGCRDAGKLTAQLVILYDGANISAQMDHYPAAAAAARDAAADLLNTAAHLDAQCAHTARR